MSTLSGVVTAASGTDENDMGAENTASDTAVRADGSLWATQAADQGMYLVALATAAENEQVAMATAAENAVTSPSMSEWQTLSTAMAAAVTQETTAVATANLAQDQRRHQCEGRGDREHCGG